MAYKVKFSASSLKDLKSIQEYICEDNREAAKEIVAHIIEKIETVIVPNPGAGRAGRVLRTRELVISKYPYSLCHLSWFVNGFSEKKAFWNVF